MIQALPFQEPNVALNSVPVLQSELFVVEPQANAQRDQNVDDLKRVVNWFVMLELPNLLEPDVVEEDSSQEKLAKLTELVQSNLMR